MHLFFHIAGFFWYLYVFGIFLINVTCLFLVTVFIISLIDPAGFTLRVVIGKLERGASIFDLVPPRLSFLDLGWMISDLLKRL